jgi:hypothetical protein
MKMVCIDGRRCIDAAPGGRLAAGVVVVVVVVVGA